MDHWALGVLLFELTAGRVPFPGECTEQVQECIREREGRVLFPKHTFSANHK